jgi:hypothetical protein
MGPMINPGREKIKTYGAEYMWLYILCQEVSPKKAVCAGEKRLGAPAWKKSPKRDGKARFCIPVFYAFLSPMNPLV